MNKMCFCKEGIKVVEQTLCQSQAETPTAPKSAGMEMDSVLKVKEEKVITEELDSLLDTFFKSRT